MPAACMRARTDDSGSSTSSRRLRSPALSMRSAITGARSAIAAASAAGVARHRPRTAGPRSRRPLDRTEHVRSQVRLAERAQLVVPAAGSSRYPASIVSNATPPRAVSAASAAVSVSLASWAHFGISLRRPSLTSDAFFTGAYAACPPPADAATPAIAPSSNAIRTALGASETRIRDSSSGVVSRRSSSATSTAGFALRPTSSRRSNSVRNSSEVNRRRTASTSHSPMTASSGRTSSSRSVLSCASSLLRTSCSPAASIESLSLPFSSAVRPRSSSIEPKSCTSLDAVFSPTPGTPGMLSEVSPFSAT